LRGEFPRFLRFGFIFLLISSGSGETMYKDDLGIPQYLPFLAVFAGLLAILLIELLTRWFSA